MFTTLVMAVTINCAQPRLDFRSWHQQAYTAPWKGIYGEPITSYHERLAEALINFADYSQTYRDECGSKK